jgi:hypothetical protein
MVVVVAVVEETHLMPAVVETHHQQVQAKEITADQV